MLMIIFHLKRRRWGPSTMANVVDLLGSTNIISKRNPSMSKLFMFYQLFAITSAILAPATICLLIAGWCFVFEDFTGHMIIFLMFQLYLNKCKNKTQEEHVILMSMCLLYCGLQVV